MISALTLGVGIAPGASSSADSSPFSASFSSLSLSMIARWRLMWTCASSVYARRLVSMILYLRWSSMSAISVSVGCCGRKGGTGRRIAVSDKRWRNAGAGQ
jgi:hypothetical protein